MLEERHVSGRIDVLLLVPMIKAVNIPKLEYK